MSDKENKTKWKLSSHALPLAYIVLICIGYTEKSIFYSKFDIEIAPYLNFEEYLFIFLPIGSILIVIFFIFSIYMSGLFGASYALFGGVKNILENSEIPKNKCREIYFYKKTKKIRRVLATILITILFIAPLSLIFIFAITKTFYMREFTVIIFIWGLIMLLLSIYLSFKKESPVSLLLIYAFAMSFLIPILWNQKTKKADKILSGKPDIKVSFINDNKLIKTNDTLVFIGQTKGYLFLRDLKSNGNSIYKKDNISNVKIIANIGAINNEF
ncbi:hypothetical protein [Pontimicrobium sp. MEBiC06410]